MQDRWHASARQHRLVVLMRKSSEIEVDVAGPNQSSSSVPQCSLSFEKSRS